MDETDSVVPWEKQQRLLYPLDSKSSSPVRKSFSYAGVHRTQLSGQSRGTSSDTTAAVAGVSTPIALIPHLPTSEEKGLYGNPSLRKSSVISDPVSIICQAGAKMKFIPFFAKHGESQVPLSGGSFSSGGHSSFSLIRFVIATPNGSSFCYLL